MSDYGNPPQDPNAQPAPGQPAYGQPNPYAQQPTYGQPNPYAQQPAYGQPGYGAPVAGYASWFQRVGARVIDGLIVTAVLIPAYIGLFWALSDLKTTTDQFGNQTTTGDVRPAGIIVMIVFSLAALGFSIWNQFIRQGRTGYSIGKGVLGIKLIGEQTGQPIGAGMAFLRELCHIVDAIPCYVGYLWPLWDAKRQTFADKIMTTIVINQPKG